MIFFWKLKNEDEKWRGKKWRFFRLDQKYQIDTYKIFELRWFQICAQIFHIFLGSKATPLQSGSTLALFGRFSLSLEGCNFWSKKDMKNLSTDLESAKFKYSKKYQFDIFGRAEKIFIFSSSFFHLHFSIFKKMLINQNILLKIIFSTVYGFVT